MTEERALRTAVASWAGGRRFTGQTGRGGGFEVETEDGLPGPRPTELLLGALATCAGLDVISIMEKKRQVVNRYRVTASGTQVEAHPQVFSAITVDHEIAGPDVDPLAVRRCVELSATRYCPVNAMLASGDVRITHRFRLGTDGASPFAEVVVTGPQGRGLAARPGALRGRRSAARELAR